MDIRKLDEPLNADERFLYGINVRLNILIEMFSSFLDVYANKNSIAVTENKVVENVVVEEVTEEVDYSKLTKSELIDELNRLGIEFDSKMLKADLIELLK